MKRLAAILLSAALLFALAACDSNATATTTTVPSSPASTTTKKPVSTTTEYPGPQGRVSGVDSVLNIRSGPGSDHKSIGQVANGTVLNIITPFCSGIWHEVEFMGQSGYVSSVYIEIIK